MTSGWICVHFVDCYCCYCNLVSNCCTAYHSGGTLLSFCWKSVPLIYFGKMTSALSPMIWHVVTWCNCYDLLWRRYWCCLLWFSFLCLFQSDWSGAALFSGQGLAFQLIDDVLDFTGTSASLGKGSLSDIRNVILLSLMYNVNVEKFSWAWKVHWSKDINVVDRSVRKSAIFVKMFLQLS